MSPDERASALRTLAEEPALAWRALAGKVDGLVASGAPLRTLKAALAPGLEPTRAYSATREWARKHRTGILVLSGTVGVGKSVAAARYALETSALWLHAPSLGMADYAQGSRLVERHARAPHLVIDELGGQGSDGPAGVARLSAVLVRRQAAGRPVVVTTNLDIAAIAKVYDGVDPARSRLADRIRESGAYVECRRTQSFRVKGGGGVNPDCDDNPYEIAKRGLRLIELLDSGETASDLLDELQALIRCSDEDVAVAAGSPGYSEALMASIDALLEKTRVTEKPLVVTCSSGVVQASSDAFGRMEGIS